MDFTTALATPIAIRINGTSYSLRRFLLPQMKQWAAERQQAITDMATKHLDADGKARFLLYFQAPPVDIFELAKYARSPDGAADIVDRQMKGAGVPDDVRTAVINNADPLLIANLADQLASSNNAAAGAKSMTEEEAKATDPLAGQSSGQGSNPPAESPASPGTGATSSPTSDTSTPAQTPTG